MSVLYKPDAPAEEVYPAVGANWKLEELQSLVGGYIETVPTGVRDWLLIVNDEGRLGLKVNPVASVLAGQIIVGNAVLVRRDGEELAGR